MKKQSLGFFLAIAGCAAVVLAFIVVALVIFDKPHFGGLVGTPFLWIVSSGVIAGGLLVAIGTWLLPIRRTWRGAVLFVWALIAITSPGFGFLFLAPWSVLALTLPVVIAILWRLRSAH